MRTRQHASHDTCLQSRAKTFVCRNPTQDPCTFPTLLPQHVKEVMISRDGPFLETGVLALWMVKRWLDVVSLHDLPMEELMSCLVLSSQQRLILLFTGARTDSNNTQQQVPELTPTTPNKNSQMTAMIEALSFLGPFGPVVRDMDSCILL